MGIIRLESVDKSSGFSCFAGVEWGLSVSAQRSVLKRSSVCFIYTCILFDVVCIWCPLPRRFCNDLEVENSLKLKLISLSSSLLKSECWIDSYPNCVRFFLGKVNIPNSTG